MKFKTELHCHSATVSNCASVTPAEIVEKYLARGYTTVVLMEHLNGATFKEGGRYQGDADWQHKIDYYMQGYHALREAAAGRLHVLLGCELCLAGTRTDYLIHGITEEFLRQNADLMEIKKIEKVAKRVRENGFLLYQAHPFRNHMTITDPKHLDGVEVYNAHPRHDSRNDLAMLWATRYGLRRISGSDLHDPDDEVGGGILTDTPITSREQLLEVLREQRYTLLRDGKPGAAK